MKPGYGFICLARRDEIYKDYPAQIGSLGKKLWTERSLCGWV